ncbi:MAG: D-alanyl-D-alanine carboxypeptidase, partial [Lactobacillus iners]|nr:D-alanyl-D-alanine carboxypeptidase [Lactobacillus iners]
NNYSLHIYKRWTQFPGKTLIKVKSSPINEVRACLYQDTGIWISKDQKLDAELSMNKKSMPIKVGTNIGKLIFPNIPALNNENALAFDATTSKELK